MLYKIQSMKRTIIATALLLLAMSFSGCLYTLHPLFTAKDLSFDPRLTGSWKTANESDVITFERGTPASFSRLPEAVRQLADKAYTVTVKDGDGQVEQMYYAFLVNIGGNHYLDYFPAETPWQQLYDSFYRQHFTPLHSIYRVQFNGDRSFDASQFDNNYLEGLISKKQIRIRHEERTDGTTLITASTGELQQYVLKYGNVPQAYENTSTYQKIATK